MKTGAAILSMSCCNSGHRNLGNKALHMSVYSENTVLDLTLMSGRNLGNHFLKQDSSESRGWELFFLFHYTTSSLDTQHNTLETHSPDELAGHGRHVEREGLGCGAVAVHPLSLRTTAAEHRGKEVSEGSSLDSVFPTRSSGCSLRPSACRQLGDWSVQRIWSMWPV